MSLLYTLALAATRRIDERPAGESEQSKKQSMKITDFSDDILNHMFAFLATMEDLKSFSLVNKRAHQWVFSSTSTDPLFGAAYERAFGTHRSSNGRQAWRDLYNIRQCLSQQINETNPFQLHTVGVLPPDRETEAVGYDHPIHFRSGQCLGYFGITRVFPQGEGPLAIWGDFDGICLVPSINDLLPCKPGQARGTNFSTRLGGDSQVLTVLASPLSYSSNTNKSSTFFLGYASGKVQAVKATQEGERYNYEIISTASAHTDEVTKLTVLPLNPPCVASSSVDGTVLLYPDSFSRNPSLHNATLACKNASKILCFASSTRTREPNGALLCTGDETGHLTLWSLVQTSSHHHDFSYKMMSSELVEAGGSLPTLIEFLHQSSNTIVVGTNSGGLFTFRVASLHYLVPLHAAPTAHVGAVDSIKIVGNVVFTSGGYEGHVMGWDTRTLSPLGSIAVHPGRLYPPGHTGRTQALLNCAVIDSIVWPERESIVSLCRDGTVHEYPYAVSKKNEESQVRPAAPDNVKENAVQSKPRSIATLQFVLSSADDSMRVRMQRSIIQAGLQNKADPARSFTGPDDIIYDDSKTAFDLFSGLSPCQSCKENGVQVS